MGMIAFYFGTILVNHFSDHMVNLGFAASLLGMLFNVSELYHVCLAIYRVDLYMHSCSTQLYIQAACMLYV